MIYKPYDYQKTAMRWVLDHPRCCLFLDMGLGKTVSTLTAVQRMLDDCEVERVLVVAPKKVAEATWTTEADKWDHLRGLKVAKVMGTLKQRMLALEEKADVYVIGRDNFVWLCGRYEGFLPFDALIIDELTSFKSSTSQRFKAMKIATPAMRRVIGLTGTPAPNGYMDLWAQMYCIDNGERLGKSVTRFRDTFFETHTWNNITVRCDLKEGCKKVIDHKIADICLSMQAKDYLQLPQMIVHTIKLQLSEKVMKAYYQFEKDKVLEFRDKHTGERAEALANSAAGLMTKLSQFANGAIYDEEGEANVIHDEKIEKLMELIEGANGSSVLVFYQYRHDAERITQQLMKAYGKGFRVERYKDEKTLRGWNEGRINVLLAHPASTAYGLNMQQGGHYIVWFGTGWNLELYQQANARLHRQGQEHPVIVYKLLAADTVDVKAAASLEGKKSVQQGLLDSLKELMDKYGQG